MVNVHKFIVVGDKLLIKPEENLEKTTSGLYLPPHVLEKERVQSGYVIKVGPGYPIGAPVEDEEPWKEENKGAKYIPLQAKEGDLAIFLRKEAIEIEFEKEKYIIVPQAAVLLLFRDDILEY